MGKKTLGFIAGIVVLFAAILVSGLISQPLIAALQGSMPGAYAAMIAGLARFAIVMAILIAARRAATRAFG